MKKNKPISIILGIMMLLSVTSCGGGQESVKEVDVSVWTVDATQKILLNKTYQITEQAITVSGAKGEFEGWQIGLTVNDNSPDITYDVKVSDLKNQTGDVFASECIQVYHELYIETQPTFKEYYTDEDFYPDGMLPMSVAKEYKENVIKAGTNQAVYVEFGIPYEQLAGIYTGKVEITYADRKVEIPVTLEVWDFAVSDITHAKSVFATQWTDFHSAELDSTDEMYDAYNEKLLEFRLSPTQIITDNQNTDADIKRFTEKAYEYAVRKDCSTISLPVFYENVTVEREVNGTIKNVSERNLNVAIFKKYIDALTQKSAETGVNILEKCVLYWTWIDEPQLNKTQERVKLFCETFSNTKETIALTVENDSSLINSKVPREELADSIRNISNVVTGYYEDSFEGLEIDYCPTPDWYDTESNRAKYANNERWWYCVLGPNNPYPTYHIDDHLLATRLLYWMAAEYDVIGNLNWGVNSYGENTEDYYQYVGDQRARGEGYIFYPGAEYGIYGPVETLRLHTYRDGIEEFEFFYALKEIYKNSGLSAVGEAFSVDAVIDILSESLYDGTRWSTTESNFYKQRQALAAYTELAQSEAGVCLTDLAESGSTLKLTFFTKNKDVFVNGEKQTDYTVAENGRIYALELDLQRYSEFVEISFQGENRTLRFSTPGKMTSMNAVTYAESFEADTTSANDVTISQVAGTAYPEANEEQLLKWQLDSENGAIDSAIVFKDDMLKQLSQGVTGLEFVVYGNQKLNYEISFLYKGGAMVGGRPIYTIVSAGTIEPGESILSVKNVNSFNWEKYKEVLSILIRVTGENGEPVDLYVSEIIIKE